jgi:flavin reductase (DIM6/NTAB) family NADH-FMN oxidoreductase RutF
MLFDFAELSGRERYKLLVATITPRPIAWVVSQNASGRLNAAPFSFFNAFSGEPPVIGNRRQQPRARAAEGYAAEYP